MIKKIKSELKKEANPKKAQIALRFFKTGKGEYGEGDKFLGISGKDQVSIAKKYCQTATLSDCAKLLRSRWHEERQVALRILRLKSERAKQETIKKKIYNLYFAKIKNINNWDLVDCSAPYIVGNWLYKRNRSILFKLAQSKNLWKKRIAIVSTFYFIAQNDLKDTYKIAKILILDKHDLIHKAVGWALREAGKKDKDELIKFLGKNIQNMARTTLRYAIEKFPPKEKNAIMNL